MKKFDDEKIIFEIGSYVNLDKFFCMLVYRGYASAMIVYKRADQLLLQVLMDHFDSLPLQYRHIGHLHEEV